MSERERERERERYEVSERRGRSWKRELLWVGLAL